MKDLHHNMLVSRVISPYDMASDTPAVGQIIDNLGYQALEYVIATGSLADAGATFTVLLEEGDVANMSDAAAVDDANLIGTEALASFTQASDNLTFKLGYAGTKRYTRLTLTPSGNGSAALVSCVAIQMKHSPNPVA